MVSSEIPGTPRGRSSGELSRGKSMSWSQKSKPRHGCTVHLGSCWARLLFDHFLKSYKSFLKIFCSISEDQQPIPGLSFSKFTYSFFKGCTLDLLKSSSNALIFHISSDTNGGFAIPSPGSFRILMCSLCGPRVLKLFKTTMSLLIYPPTLSFNSPLNDIHLFKKMASSD